MLQSFVIYLLLTVVMMYLSYVGRAKKQWKYMVYAMLLYAVVFGMRYGVGTDHITYLFNYLAYSTTTGHFGVSQAFEPGFSLFTEALAMCNAHYTVYFGIIAFVQLFFTLLLFKNDHKLYPYLIFTFMISAMWLTYSNGLRQILALNFWIWSIKFIAERKVWKFYLTIALAVSMHSSAIMLIIFYPIFFKKNEWFTNRLVEFGLLAFSLVLMKIDIVQTIMQNVDTVMQMSRYDSYTQEDMANVMHKEVTIGAGFLITLALTVLLIFYSNKTKDFAKSGYYNIIYDLFIIGVTLKYFLLNSMVFSRINYYFINLLFIVAAYTLRYAHQHNKLLFYSIVGLIVLTFIAVVTAGDDNTATFIFFWQDDLHILKRT